MKKSFDLNVSFPFGCNLFALVLDLRTSRGDVKNLYFAITEMADCFGVFDNLEGAIACCRSMKLDRVVRGDGVFVFRR